MDNDNKKSTDKQDGTDLPISTTSVPAPKGYRGMNYFTTEEVAKIIGVTRKAVEYWRKRVCFHVLESKVPKFPCDRRFECLKWCKRRILSARNRA